MNAGPTPLPGVPAHTPPTPTLRRIRRVGILSLAKFYAIMLAVFGLLAGIMFALFSTAMVSASGGAAEGGIMAGIGVFALIVFPLLYGALGFVFGALTAWIFNLVAGWMGGLEITVE